MGSEWSVSTQETLGDRLASMRMRSNLTQRQMADITGLHYSTIYRIEQGERYPKADVLSRILLGTPNVPLSELRHCLALAAQGAAVDTALRR